MVQVLLGIVYTLTAAGALLFGASALELALRHPADGRSPRYYLARGALFFSATNFAATGAGAHRRFLTGIGLFVAGFVLAVALVLLAG